MNKPERITDRDALQTALKQLQNEKDNLGIQLAETIAKQQNNSDEQKRLSESHQSLEDEANSLRSELDETRNEYQLAIGALELVFPLDLYEFKAPELAGANKNVLLAHFIAHGQNEGRLIHYKDLTAQYDSLQAEKDSLSRQLATLDQQFDKASTQLEFLKDIIARIASRP